MIYVHIPFCKRFCTYCGFYSEICSEKVLNIFVRDLVAEIGKRRTEIAQTLHVNTLYIGGGTPSVLSAEALKTIVDALDAAPYEEFTVEVNPEDIVTKGMGYVSALREMGVNRISMGVQSFDEGILRWMGRRHDARDAVRSFRMLRDGGFDNISLDLIFGLSQLTRKTWEETIDRTVDMGPEHVSAYQLSIEEGSALEEMVDGGQYTEASDEHCRSQYDTLCEKLHDAGFHHYEISNFSVPGREAVHNSAYWRRVPYIGFGPGAHSLLFSGPDAESPDLRSWNSESLHGWEKKSENLSAEEIREERIMLGLRTEEGFEGTVIPERDWFVSDEIIRNLI